MIHIFHGDNQTLSRQAFNAFIDQRANDEIYRIDSKEIDLNQLNNFINGASLFATKKVLAISNYFSISKPVQEKLSSLLVKGGIEGGLEITIWQDKTLTLVQLKPFSKAIIQVFKQNNSLWGCLNSLQPHNTAKLIPLYQKIIDDNYDLFLYLVKAQIRKGITTSSRFNPISLKKAYLHLIELDFANKTGQLSISKDIALERILIDLMEN